MKKTYIKPYIVAERLKVDSFILTASQTDHADAKHDIDDFDEDLDNDDQSVWH